MPEIQYCKGYSPVKKEPTGGGSHIVIDGTNCFVLCVWLSGRPVTQAHLLLVGQIGGMCTSAQKNMKGVVHTESVLKRFY
jgi:hypothetical protein